MNTHALTLALLLAFAPSCAREDAGKVGEPSHAAASAVPGSYDDWCAEHQVPESKCTRCDPSLVAAFKATNDWCAEHGVPESQCRECKPGLEIARPPKPEGP